MKKLFGFDLKNVLLSLWFTHPQETFFYVGRLYRGYVGVMINFWRFEINLWILNWEH